MDKIKRIIEGMLTFLCTMVPVVIIITFVVLAWQNNSKINSEAYKENKKLFESYFDLEVLCEKGGRQICYDKNTNVLYYQKSGNSWYDLTPILNSDGTPKLYEE